MLSEQMEAEHLEGDQARLERYERGVFEATNRDLNEVPPYQNDKFMQQVQRLAAFDHVRAAPPAQAEAATVDADTARGCGWSQGSIPSSASSVTSPVELSPAWIARTMNGVRAQYGHLHPSLRYCSLEMLTLTRLKLPLMS